MERVVICAYPATTTIPTASNVIVRVSEVFHLHAINSPENVHAWATLLANNAHSAVQDITIFRNVYVSAINFVNLWTFSHNHLRLILYYYLYAFVSM